MLLTANIVDDANHHLQIYETAKSVRDAYDDLPKCPECGHNEIDHSDQNQPPGCWNCGCKGYGKTAMKENIKESKLKPRVIGPCTGKNCGHCRYLNETIKSLKKAPKEGSIPFEDVEALESLKRVLAVHKSGRNL